MNIKINDISIAIVGLGYVGLPLAIEFAKKFPVLGFDINKKRVRELSSKKDITNEADLESLSSVMDDSGRSGLRFTDNPEDISGCNVYIITVPTPINHFKAPDLNPLLSASKMIGQILKKNDIVIYESTVYPGCTEEDCVPVLEKFSKLKFNIDFFCGYSPERINPGDKVNTLVKIKKVTSGSSLESANFVDQLYSEIIVAGTHKAPSIKVAEASKAIENAQRDLNISFVNELALIFDLMNIDTQDVLDAASTKWNFLNFKPGLVGGHCIGVDPYYLTHKAQSLGYDPQVILSGRRVNDHMGSFIANKTIKLLISKKHNVNKSSILILGCTFKEDCPDIRNSKVFDIVNELNQFKINVDLYDPHVDKKIVLKDFGIKLIDRITRKYNAIILAVPHKKFQKINLKKHSINSDTIIFDVKSVLKKSQSTSRL